MDKEKMRDIVYMTTLVTGVVTIIGGLALKALEGDNEKIIKSAMDTVLNLGKEIITQDDTLD